MAGIYIHIPFCRQKCYYCDFYKTVNGSQTVNFLEALKKEAERRKDYLKDEPVKTIYFGGGTPSVLKEDELIRIVNVLHKHYRVEPHAEVTFEANPDDLTPVYLASLREAGINRLSIGIQSFSNVLLKKMNRRHDALQAVKSIENAFASGFTNLSTDLIYGLPGLTINQWEKDLKEMFRLPVNHLSAYHLTYHQGTPFYTWLKKGTLKELSEEESIKQFQILLNESDKAGFEQYEISNFARDNMYSAHNKSYWFGENYLGLGPSAHSFNGTSRRWNAAHLEGYINGLEKGTSWFEEEQLTETDMFNEYILTRIRTKWGISMEEVNTFFGPQAAARVKHIAQKYKASGKLIESGNQYLLSREGLFVSDSLITDFIIV